MDRQTVFDYITKKYKAKPEYPWRKYSSYAVFRHADNNKWFALVMDVPGDKVGVASSDYVDVINLKVDDLFFRDMIIQDAGIMPAYHMNKMHWITVLLNGTVPQERVFDLIDMSFLATASAKKKEKLRPAKEWIIPSIRSISISSMPLTIRMKSTGSREPESKLATPCLCMWERPYQRFCISAKLRKRTFPIMDTMRRLISKHS